MTSSRGFPAARSSRCASGAWPCRDAAAGTPSSSCLQPTSPCTRRWRPGASPRHRIRC